MEAGHELIKQGKFTVAANTYQEAMRQDPEICKEDAFSWMKVATLYPYVGDVVGYRQVSWGDWI